MEALLVLICIQLAGVILSFFILSLRTSIDRKRFFLNRYRSFVKRQEKQQWLINYFEEHPKSRLRRHFPHLYKVAKATKRYKEINLLRAKGYISDKEYEGQLEAILPLIDITSDFEINSYK